MNNTIATDWAEGTNNYYTSKYVEIYDLGEMGLHFFKGSTMDYGADHLRRETLGVDEASALALRCGALGWDNHRIKQ